MDDRLKRQLEFALYIDKEKNVFRQTHLSGHGRNENDAEHAWHMAVMSYLLKEYSNEKIDAAKTMIMCLIHDIVEIEAGDTYAYDEAAKETQREREEAAKEKIFAMLPDDQRDELCAIFDEFEANETSEARFARAMDNLQPLILNDSNGGSDWREHGVSSQKVYGRQEATKLGSAKIYEEVTDPVIKKHIASGSLDSEGNVYDRAAVLSRLRDGLDRHFVGKRELADDVICCFLAGGHLLLEDVPGVGKTTLAKSFAGLLGMSFARIQFTPDTQPADITGSSVYNMKTGEFEHMEGSVMKNIILADELNRTSPKTQAALLEAMSEAQVTVDGNIYPLPDPFMVIATQNPASFTGTFPLQEAQLDRFMMRLSLGYLDADEEMRMARQQLTSDNKKEISPVVSSYELTAMKCDIASVTISDAVLRYAEDIIRATRSSEELLMGASPRALLHLLGAARAKAYISGRSFLIPDDIKHMAYRVLSHRMSVTSELGLKDRGCDHVLDAILAKVSVPVE